MPIRPENRALYPADWKAISRRIRYERAAGRCEWCRAPDRVVVGRSECGTYYTLGDTAYSTVDGSPVEVERPYEIARYSRIVLTVAHLDCRLVDHSDANLAALCQRCHNTHDAKARRAGIVERARAAASVGDLFAGAA